MRTVAVAALGYALAARLFEIVWSARNARRVLARGGRRVRPDGFAGLAFTHTVWFLAMGIEEVWRGPRWSHPAALATAWTVFAASEALRYVCIVTLGDRWNLNVLVEPGVPRVRRGIYRFLRHPNYVAATVGLVALPLALALPWSAALIAPLKLLAVRHRLACEERALVAAEDGAAA